MIDNLSLIVAIGKNNELGKDNQLLWHLKGDLAFFKEKTMGHTIIMGRKTFESLPKMLPNRKHIIISRNEKYLIDGALILHSEEDALEYIKNSSDECFIIGGASIYQEYLPFCKTLYITKIDATTNADAFFPLIDEKLYQKTVSEPQEENGIKYQFVKYLKK